MRKERIVQIVHALIISVLVVFSFGATGEICGFFFRNTDKAFGNLYPDNNPSDIREVMKRIAENGKPGGGPLNSLGIPVAVMTVQDEPRAIAVINLKSGETMWRLKSAISSPVMVAGDLVIWKVGNQVTAHSLKDGRGLWSYKLDEGWNFYGADSDGDIVAMAVGVGGLEPGGYANGKVVVLNARNGLKKWEHSAGTGILGKPTVIGDLIFAPWDRQKVVIIDVKRGEEICRIRAADFAVNFLKKTDGELYYGSLTGVRAQGAIHRFNELSASGTAEGSTSFTPNLRPVPGDPYFGLDAYGLSSGGRSTEEKIRFHYEPAPGVDNVIRFEGDVFYLHYWSYIIAFDAATSTVRFTYRSPKNIESMTVVKGGGALAVDTDGALFYLDPQTGTESWRLDTKEKILNAVFDANGFSKPSAAAAALDPVQSLKNLIMDRDNRLLPIRAYGVGLLGAVPRPEITQTLLEIYSEPSSPKMLRAAVEKAIESRNIGAEYLVNALNMKYDYLEGTQPPPMKLVAPALINMKEKQAVPALIGHLLNHETPIDDMVSIIAALHELGDAQVAAPLIKLITLYHADTAFLGHEQTLTSAAYTLMKFGDKESTNKFITKIRDDEQTLPELRRLLRGVLDPELVAKEAAEAKAREDAEKKAEEEKARLAAEAAFVPDSLSKEQINGTIVKNQELFSPCIMDAIRKSPELRQIRLRFLIAGSTGTASDLKSLPNNINGLQSCLANAFGMIQFRKFKTSSQLATYTISIAEPMPKDE